MCPVPQKKKRGRAALFRQTSAQARARLGVSSAEKRSWRSHNQGPFARLAQLRRNDSTRSRGMAALRLGEDAGKRRGIERLHEVAVEARVERLAAVFLGAVAAQRD